MGPDPGWAALVLLFAASLLTVAAWLLQYWRSAALRARRRRGAAAEAGARALLSALLSLRPLREQWQKAWVRALNSQARRNGVRRGPGERGGGVGRAVGGGGSGGGGCGAGGAGAACPLFWGPEGALVAQRSLGLRAAGRRESAPRCEQLCAVPAARGGEQRGREALSITRLGARPEPGSALMKPSVVSAAASCEFAPYIP